MTSSVTPIGSIITAGNPTKITIRPTLGPNPSSENTAVTNSSSTAVTSVKKALLA